MCLAHPEWYHTWAGGPEFYTKAEKAEHSALPRSLHEFPPPGFCPTGLSVFTDSADELSYETVSEINPILPKLLLVTVFHHSNSNDKTGSQNKTSKEQFIHANLVWRSFWKDMQIGMPKTMVSQHYFQISKNGFSRMSF